MPLHWHTPVVTLRRLFHLRISHVVRLPPGCVLRCDTYARDFVDWLRRLPPSYKLTFTVPACENPDPILDAFLTHGAKEFVYEGI